MPEPTVMTPELGPEQMQALAASLPVVAPQASLVWTAVVDIGAREGLGPSSHGERFVVPIVGGHFWGGTGFEAFRGWVRSGGADRQLLRPDGVKELHALYEMQTDEGAVLTIDNRVLVDESRQPKRYALSRITVVAPQGPHGWMNRRLFVGTLQTLRPARDAVVVRGFLMSD